MQVNRYLPPNKRATIIKEKVICKDDMVLFPSLNNSKKEVQSARDDELSGWSNIVKPMDDIENDDNGNAILSSSFYDNLELEYDNYNNYINRKSAVAFEKMLTMDVVYKSQPIYSSFIYWFNDMMDNVNNMVLNSRNTRIYRPEVLGIHIIVKIRQLHINEMIIGIYTALLLILLIFLSIPEK